MRLIGIALATLLSSTAFGNDFFMASPETGHTVTSRSSTAISASQIATAATLGWNTVKGAGAVNSGDSKGTEVVAIEYRAASTAKRTGAKSFASCADVITSDEDCFMSETVTTAKDGKRTSRYHYNANGGNKTGSNGAATKSVALAQKYLDLHNGSGLNTCLQVQNDNCDTITDTAANTAICDAYEYAWQKALDKGWSVDEAKAAVNVYNWGSDTLGGDDRFCSSSGGTQANAWSTGYCNCAVSGTTVTCGTIDGTACFRN